MALPLDHETMIRGFGHHPAATVPRVTLDGVSLEIIAGTAYGARSPLGVLAPTLYVHAGVDAGAPLVVDDEHEERAIYLVEGAIACDGCVLQPGPSAKVEITARSRRRA